MCRAPERGSRRAARPRPWRPAVGRSSARRSTWDVLRCFRFSRRRTSGSLAATMSSAIEMPLILGGHTFIHQLGSDPPTTPEQQATIVELCLNQGITWIDTTYEPERIALGGVLERLGRRDEAQIIAWNF